MTEASVTITLPGERPQSWNKAYAGQHWAKRKAEVERIRMAVRAVINPETCQVFAGQVDITVTVFFDKRPFDADNVPAKFYVDACKGWILEDDDQHHVRSVTTVSLLDPQQSRVVIEVRPVQNGAFEWAVHTPEGGYAVPADVADFLRQNDRISRLVGIGELPWMPPYIVPAEVVEASRHRCLEVEQTGRQAGVAERYELQPAPEGSRVLVAGVREQFEQGAALVAEPAAGSGAFLRLDF